MKWRSVLFIITGALASVAGVAYAATAAPSPGGETPIGVIVAIAMSGLSQLGSTAMLVKRYMTKVDKDGETIPTLVATLEANKLAMTTIAANQTELFESRNDHAKQLTEINLIHEMLECKKNIQRSGEDRRKSPRS
ncbi:exported hypothetical protein [Gammaproteobacteria bacterium]